MNSGAQSGEPMTCPRCGAEMNHHADKVLYSDETGETGSRDSTTGGSIQEMHACPNCGAGTSRAARDGDGRDPFKRRPI
jgi:ribosomal protein S27AE